MTCDDLIRRFTDLADGALPDALCDELRRHLATCHHCAELQRDLEALARLCRQCAPPRLPDELRRRLAARIGRPDARG
jgi:anti-sigma factor (TIGR02949 family)